MSHFQADTFPISRPATAPTLLPNNIKLILERKAMCHCFAPSPRRPYIEDKRMVLEHTHGLFIT